MATFGVEIEDTQKLRSFITKTTDRLKESDFMKNPFKGDIIKFQDFIVVSMKPIYPNIWWVAFFILIPAFIFNAPLWSILSLPFFLIGFIHSNLFFFLMFRKGLKKEGYKGRCKLLPQYETIEKLLKEL